MNDIEPTRERAMSSSKSCIMYTSPEGRLIQDKPDFPLHVAADRVAMLADRTNTALIAHSSSFQAPILDN